MQDDLTAVAERYRRRADAFERGVRGVRADQWAAPTPCSAWCVRDVVDHVVGMHGFMLGPLDRSLPPSPTTAEDPLGAFLAARGAIEAVLADPALCAVEARTPTGPMPVGRQIDEIVSDDMPQHLWDLARATGQDDTIDPDDVERLWAITTAISPEMMARYRTPDAFGPGVVVFGPEVVVAADAPLQDRLLGLIGRDPNWEPPALG